MPKIKAILLFSGGLDSILAAKILQKQGIKVTLLTFISYFFDAKQAKESAKKLGLKLKIVDFSKEHLKMVKNPKYGYGKAANPCIDCHSLMLRFAKRIMKKENYHFVATGEVLGERPFSQNIQALKIVEKESGLSGFLLRPLSAKLLEQTIPEKKGWVERDKLLAISGRSRKPQIELAKKFGFKKYPQPAGGCILTEIEFGKRLKELLKNRPRCSGNDIQLLKLGRHFWFDSGKIILGRNHEENLKIKKLAKKNDILMELKNIPGPLVLIRGKKSARILQEAGRLAKRYSRQAKDKKSVELKYQYKNKKLSLII